MFGPGFYLMKQLQPGSCSTSLECTGLVCQK